MSRPFLVRPMQPTDVDDVVGLQRACFPPPFPEEFLWRPEHIRRHLEVFPEGQLVAVADDRVVASASNCVISEAAWSAHKGWDATVGGPFLENHDPAGATLYGLDISVHPDWRGQGVGRALYRARFDLVRALRLTRYGTACRLPGFSASETSRGRGDVELYALRVVEGKETDRTLTPLLRYGLAFRGVLRDYMEDMESGNAAALLEWKP